MALVFAANLAGCEQITVGLGKIIFPDRDHVVILEPREFSKLSGEYDFDDETSPVIREDSNSLCFVLSAGDNTSSDDLDNVIEFRKSTGLNASVFLQDGTEYILQRSSASWNLEGRILDGNEKSACLILDCNEKIEAGKLLAKITFSATIPITAKGLYWVGIDPL